MGGPAREAFWNGRDGLAECAGELGIFGFVHVHYRGVLNLLHRSRHDALREITLFPEFPRGGQFTGDRSDGHDASSRIVVALLSSLV